MTASEDCRLDGVRDECEILIKEMDLANITAKSDFKKLNRDSMERVFVKRTERLETVIREVYPQLVGLVEYCLYLKLASSSVITCCPQHFLANKSYTDLLERIRSCFVCKQMITQLVTTSVTRHLKSNHKPFSNKGLDNIFPTSFKQPDLSHSS